MLTSGWRLMKTTSLALALCLSLAACGQADRSKAQEGFNDSLAERDRRVPADADTMRESFAPVARVAGPAVVNISALQLVRQRDPFWEFFGGQPRVGVAQSIGSGVIVRSDGVVVTNNHVIQGAQEIRIVLSDRREYEARVLLADPRQDLAVLKIDELDEELPVLRIDDRENLQVGDLVLAIGNPFGVGQTVTSGIISALNRTETGISDSSSFVQTDAAINPGNSGGALVDMDGDLIGINTAIFSRSGSSAGVGFAIPAAAVRRAVESAVGGSRTIIRPWLGATGQGVTAEIARSLGLDRPSGVVVSEVYPNSPAARAGIREGDIITAVDGNEVNDLSGLNFRVGAARPGTQAQISLLRDGRAQTVTARLDTAPDGPRDPRRIQGRNPFSGATFVNLTPAAADELGASAFTGPGALVTEAPQGSIAAAIGLQPGDVVTAVNGRPIRSSRELAEAAAAYQGGSVVTIIRDGRERSARL
ncbi:Do family serine endopeptidase [Brevundimonas sp. 2R-24]|uniref:Do family serine endopeptidase n=1 Tax=Peiella sedimenti TaxID=3061083 RepID=A0ABT8SNW4_9CAUL|nr:Do family serine endopeptidase [Caulobacteraceae bacterium XZ-24]